MDDFSQFRPSVFCLCAHKRKESTWPFLCVLPFKEVHLPLSARNLKGFTTLRHFIRVALDRLAAVYLLHNMYKNRERPIN